MTKSNRFLVYFKNKRNVFPAVLRTAEHTNRNNVPEKEFRIQLLKDYNSRNRRVLGIVRLSK